MKKIIGHALLLNWCITVALHKLTSFESGNSEPLSLENLLYGKEKETKCTFATAVLGREKLLNYVKEMNRIPYYLIRDHKIE